MSSHPKAYFYRKIVKAKLYIDALYAESIDVDDIASGGHFSKYDFIRQFKKVYQKTPYNYLKYVRINKAMELLHDGRSISDACFDVGYESLSSFSGLFKKETGLSPSQYQKAYREREASIENQPLGYIPGCYSEKFNWKKSNFEEIPGD